MKFSTSFNYHYNPKSQQLDVILHGGSQGIESTLIQKVFDKCKQAGNCVVAFNFPYLERGEENSSGPQLSEETETLQHILDYCDYKHFAHIRLIAKSLGGIVASYYLGKLSKDEMSRLSITVLGFVTGDVKIETFTGPITIIQGEKDKFGGIKSVKEDMKNTSSKNVTYIEIPNADHSYRDPETKEPIYEYLAVAKIV